MSEHTGDTAPVDTLSGPHEPSVDTPSTIPMLLLVLTGPVAVLTHFWIVYLFAEASCAAERTGDGLTFVGPDGLTSVILVATIVGVLITVIAAVIAWRRRDLQLSFVGSVMSIGSAATIAAVGLPILVLAPC